MIFYRIGIYYYQRLWNAKLSLRQIEKLRTGTLVITDMGTWGEQAGTDKNQK